LVVARFLQALGGCAGLVAPRAIVRDEFPVTDTPRIFSLIVLILGISPIVAPTIGGYIVSRTSWDNIFAVLLILGVLLAICSWFIIPDHQVNANVSLSPRAITKSYIDVLKNRDFITSALINALSASGFYCYLSGAPSVFMGGYRLSEHIFSVLFSIIAAGLIGSTQLNLLLLKRSRPAPIISAALVAQNLFGLILVAGTTIFDLPLSLLITIIFFIISCQGLTTPNATAGALEPFSSNAGLASALLGTVQMGMGAIASSLVSHWIGNGKMTMAIGMFCCSFMALLIDRWRRMRLQRGQPAVSTI
jgi:DHA1 family bicyclomycin/chloramphenicol resistance-like MFS transporter